MTVLNFLPPHPPSLKVTSLIEDIRVIRRNKIQNGLQRLTEATPAVKVNFNFLLLLLPPPPPHSPHSLFLPSYFHYFPVTPPFASPSSS